MRHPSYRLFVLFALLTACDADFYSATFRLENLAKIEQQMVESARRYIQQGGQVPWTLQRLCESMSHPGYSDPVRMVHSPVGAYLLLKRFHHTWAHIMEELPNPLDVLGQDDLAHVFPTPADLEGSALALLRLQGVYNLDLPSIAEGGVVVNCEKSQTSTDNSLEQCEPANLSRLTGQPPPLPLEVSDVFYIGSVAYKRREFYYAAIWYNLTLNLMTQRSPSEGDPGLLQVLEALGDSYSELEKYQQASAFYKRALDQGDNDHSQRLESKAEDVRNKADKHGPTLVRPRSIYNNYEELCRAGVLQRERATVETTTLTCTLVRPSALFYISPLKMEVLREKEPRVALYYDVITDGEAGVMRQLGFSKFERSTVLPSPGETVVSDTRVSETGWVPDTEDLVVAKLSRMVAHITGLNTTFPTGDNFQVLNYGLGGQYEPHYDHLKEEVSRTLMAANRILTFLFYLSEVEAGGATVFTEANIAVPVVKNSAVLFENTNKALVRSRASVHAGCPVLIGSKWVANKWIHEIGNELQRPCGLTQEE
ncbi:prolyl 4-hydroxylase subunit alpha-3-like isoform X1 [Branchiostoma floridae]|uniref:procollagen-proline 4-dioxygenase n=1 Tax=Branchiostoma floridae TaxID=7739 RepID=A0A9J7LHB8_BRAFL|nr:prolyl 4-hydroxylase subunit alpha-3-like isoform X1 [Branchiostoma floridae]